MKLILALALSLATAKASETPPPKAAEPAAEAPAQKAEAAAPESKAEGASEVKKTTASAVKAKRKAKSAVRSVADLRSAASKTNPKWELADDDDGLKVWVRDVPGTSIREVKVEAVIDSPVARVWEVITKVEDYIEFMPYIVEMSVIGKPGPGGTYIYHHLDPPLVSPRDYTLLVRDEVNVAQQRYERFWTPVAHKGPGRKKGVVRLTICDGSWLLVPAPGQKTKAQYWLYTDPGGSIPAWIANKANTSSLPDMIAAVANRSKDPSWKP